MKTEERITKPAEDGSNSMPEPPIRKSHSSLKTALGLLILMGALAYGYNYWRIHRPTSEAEVAKIESPLEEMWARLVTDCKLSGRPMSTRRRPNASLAANSHRRAMAISCIS